MAWVEGADLKSGSVLYDLDSLSWVIVVKMKSRSKIRKRAGATAPLGQVVRVLLSLCSFNTSPLYHLRAWHRLRPGDSREKLQDMRVLTAARFWPQR